MSCGSRAKTLNPRWQSRGTATKSSPAQRSVRAGAHKPMSYHSINGRSGTVDRAGSPIASMARTDPLTMGQALRPDVLPLIVGEDTLLMSLSEASVTTSDRTFRLVVALLTSFETAFRITEACAVSAGCVKSSDARRAPVSDSFSKSVFDRRFPSGVPAVLIISATVAASSSNSTLSFFEVFFIIRGTFRTSNGWEAAG